MAFAFSALKTKDGMVKNVIACKISEDLTDNVVVALLTLCSLLLQMSASATIISIRLMNSALLVMLIVSGIAQQGLVYANLDTLVHLLFARYAILLAILVQVLELLTA